MADLVWEKRSVSVVVADSPLTRLLEERLKEYYRDALEHYLHPTFFYDKLTKRRYMERSKPRPHEFGPGDAKSVLRRVRKGRAVSGALLARAVRTLVDEASYYNDD